MTTPQGPHQPPYQPPRGGQPPPPRWQPPPPYWQPPPPSYRARRVNTAGRVIWIIWCLIWATGWGIGAGVEAPHRACVLPNLIITNGNTCSQWGTVGSSGAMVVCILAFFGSIAAIWLPVGKQ